MKVRMTDKDLLLFAACAGAVMVTRDLEQRTIDSSGPSKGVLSKGNHSDNTIADFSSMTRQRRRYAERQKAKQRA